MRFRRWDVQLDEIRSGPRWLENPQIAACVQDALVRGERFLGQYHLHAYVVMPNHVHILITPEIFLCRIMRGLKGVSARDANRVLGRSGKVFWQDESYDHWVRSEKEFWKIVSYIENNPVKAGLVSKPEDWRWSSAAVRRNT
jgi:REP element-mobilizing transposase RayT